MWLNVTGDQEDNVGGNLSLTVEQSQNDTISHAYAYREAASAPASGGELRVGRGSFPKVDQAGCAKVRTNFYSVPLRSGSVVEARVYCSIVEFRQNDVWVAQHERSYERAQQIHDLEHYLEVLEREPGALRGSKPLAQRRTQGRWPDSYDQLWELMNEKHDRQSGTRSMVAVIRIRREFGYAKLETSVPQAMVLGFTDVAAIRHLLMSDELQHAAATTVDNGALAAYERLVGEPGTGNTHLAAGLTIAACRQKKRVRLTTDAELVNQLVEAQREAEPQPHAGTLVAR